MACAIVAQREKRPIASVGRGLRQETVRVRVLSAECRNCVLGIGWGQASILNALAVILHSITDSEGNRPGILEMNVRHSKVWSTVTKSDKTRYCPIRFHYGPSLAVADVKAVEPIDTFCSKKTPILSIAHRSENELSRL